MLQFVLDRIPSGLTTASAAPAGSAPQSAPSAGHAPAQPASGTHGNGLFHAFLDDSLARPAPVNGTDPAAPGGKDPHAYGNTLPDAPQPLPEDPGTLAPNVDSPAPTEPNASELTPPPATPSPAEPVGNGSGFAAAARPAEPGSGHRMSQRSEPEQLASAGDRVSPVRPAAGRAAAATGEQADAAPRVAASANHPQPAALATAPSHPAGHASDVRSTPEGSTPRPGGAAGAASRVPPLQASVVPVTGAESGEQPRAAPVGPVVGTESREQPRAAPVVPAAGGESRGPAASGEALAAASSASPAARAPDRIAMADDPTRPHPAEPSPGSAHRAPARDRSAPPVAPIATRTGSGSIERGDATGSARAVPPQAHPADEHAASIARGWSADRPVTAAGDSNAPTRIGPRPSGAAQGVAATGPEAPFDWAAEARSRPGAATAEQVPALAAAARRIDLSQAPATRSDAPGLPPGPVTDVERPDLAPAVPRATPLPGGTTRAAHAVAALFAAGEAGDAYARAEPPNQALQWDGRVLARDIVHLATEPRRDLTGPLAAALPVDLPDTAERLVATLGTAASQLSGVALDPATGKSGLTPSPLQQPGFAAELGNRLVWMVRHQVQSAQIRLNPPHLGPLEVRVSVADGETSVVFTSPHAVVREALEVALPRLRDGLGELGLTLADTQISDHSLSQRDGRSRSPDGAPPGAPDAQADEPRPDQPAPARRPGATTGVDLYA